LAALLQQESVSASFDRELCLFPVLAWWLLLLPRRDANAVCLPHLNEFRRIRRESWVRLTFLHRYVGACVLRMPACVRVCQMLTGLCVIASLSFVLMGVCQTSLSASGEAVFFPAVRTLVLAGTVIWGAACFGGRLRAVFHPDAGLARPESAAATEPPEKPCSIQGCCQMLCLCVRTFGP
jgi:hypothetical protein